MKYLHRNRMKKFYSDYAKHDTKHSKGHHHNTHHIHIMNENADTEDSSTSNLEILNLVEDPVSLYEKKRDADRLVDDLIRDAISKIEVKNDEIKDVDKQDVETDVETDEETVIVSTPIKSTSKSTSKSSEKKRRIRFLESIGVRKLKNPNTNRLVGLKSNRLGQDVIVNFIEQNYSTQFKNFV